MRICYASRQLEPAAGLAERAAIETRRVSLRLAGSLASNRFRTARSQLQMQLNIEPGNGAGSNCESELERELDHRFTEPEPREKLTRGLILARGVQHEPRRAFAL